MDCNLGVPYGRAIRYNLFIFKEKIKRISTAIPNAKVNIQKFRLRLSVSVISEYFGFFKIQPNSTLLGIN